MTIIISLVYLLSFAGIFMAVGLSGSSSVVESIIQEPMLGLVLVFLLFGFFATIMWHRKSQRQENYKIWFYFSVGVILLLLLVPMAMNWQVFLRGLS
ncbi:MAG: hypothetical protein WC735_04305 [Candidatus Paceibacterota bacterium]|jgi:hypothetical protein